MRTLCISVGLLATSLPSAALAAPVYLTCDQFEFTLDEPNATATMRNSLNGNVFRYPASFGPGMVAFGDRDVTFQIDRKTLAYSYTIRLIRDTTKGVCKIATPEKRAF